MYYEVESQKIKCNAYERFRRGFDRTDPLSAPFGADANESHLSDQKPEFPSQVLAFSLLIIYKCIIYDLSFVKVLQNIGKVGTTEVDFVARKRDNIYYFQVTASMVEESTFDREMAPLKAISDHYPKTVITLDRYTLGNYDGIQVVNAIDWLLDK